MNWVRKIVIIPENRHFEAYFSSGESWISIPRTYPTYIICKENVTTKKG